MTDPLTILGQRVTGSIPAERLESFPAPPRVTEVAFESQELAATCPVTGQPDLYTVVLEYGPADLCLESKALKLYLHGFRDRGVFCEALAQEILQAVVDAVSPRWAKVTLRQAVRGGLTLRATAEAGAR